MHLTVLACDLDGTLANHGKVASETWEMLRQAKTAGLTIILVTGRLLSYFSAEGAYAELCEAIVAENGAVVYFPRRAAVELPFGHLPQALLRRLADLKVPLERGLAIVATQVPHDETILEVLREMGGGATVEYNRGAVMLLPPGATKGTGLHYVLRELGYSPRNVVACGDAENDRSLFEMVELSVAVANAVPDIQSLADVVLPHANGVGVQRLIKDLLAEHIPIHQPRSDRRLLLGHRIDGTPVHLDPFALVDGNLGIFGASGSGKSWLAGLIAEELLKQGYQICIIDSEGDYRGLRAFPHSLVLGGPQIQLPPVVDVVTFSEYNEVNLILDLSMSTVAERAAYIIELLRAFQGLRVRRGRPHWFLVDEIQCFCPPEGGELTDLLLKTMQKGGFSVASYRPSQVSPALLKALDHWSLTRLSLPEEIEVLKPFLAKQDGGLEILSQLPTLPLSQAYFCFDDRRWCQTPTKGAVRFRAGPRIVPHIRHLHKYLRAPLPKPKRFYFHDGAGHYLGRSAASLWEFHEVLGELPGDSLRYHLRRGDFENWLQDVLYDKELTRLVKKVNSRNLRGEKLRHALLEVVINRYEELDKLT